MTSAPAVFPFYVEGVGRLFTIYHDVTRACSNRPTHDPHVTHSTRVMGKCDGRGNYHSKTPPHVPAHRSGPGPTTRCAYVWPRPGGSYRCTKVGAPLFYPSTCARVIRATPAATLSRARGRSRSARTPESAPAKGTRRAKRRQDQRHKEREGEVDSPGKSLAGAASAAQARALPGQLAQRQQGAPPLSPRVPTPSTTLEPRLGRHLHGGMQIFAKIISTQDQMRTRRRRSSARSLPRKSTGPLARSLPEIGRASCRERV